MKTQKMMLKALCALAATAAVAMGCAGLETYQINAPADLAEKKAAYEEEKKSKQKEGETPIDITVPVVGAEDNTTAWWTEFSQYFNVPAGQKLVLEFINYGTGAENWHNWNACVSNGERDGDNYSEYFVLRADAYGWGNADYNGALISLTVNGEPIDWGTQTDAFRSIMNGAVVTLTLDHAKAGVAFLEATAVNGDDVIVETYNQPVSATDPVNLFLVPDNSHFEVKQAKLIPSEIADIPDEDAISIVVAGFPSTIELGTTFADVVEGNLIAATATYADKSTALVDLADVTFTVSETFGQEVGTETVLYSYSKTKKGNYGPSVAGMVKIDVTNPVVAIAASAKAYFIGGAKYVVLSPASIVAECTYADDTKAVLHANQYVLEFADGKDVYDAVAGEYEDAFTITYTTASGEELVASGTLTIAASSLPAQTEQVGLSDNTTPWWTAFSQDWKVAPGETQSVSMYLGSDNAANYHSPCTILRKADLGEYGVVRMDHYGWGTAIGDACANIVPSSNWNWDTFASNLDGSTVAISVANNGDGMACVRYYVIYPDGTETHFQYYDSIPVDSSDVQFAMVCEGSHLIFD